jgi:H2-forming N5,N10-methylenetetrahydromethanopterin dehydrogenase-like enzyme
MLFLYHGQATLFTPFSIIQRVLQKIVEEKATGLIIVPYWPTQTWWPYLMKMLLTHPIILPRGNATLVLTAHPTQTHPLHNKLDLLLCHLSRHSFLSEEFRHKLQTLSNSHGEQAPKNNMQHTSTVGDSTVVQGVLIPFQRL